MNKIVFSGIHELDWEQFRTRGAVIQHPVSRKIYLAYGNNPSHEVEFFFLPFFGGSTTNYRFSTIIETTQSDLLSYIRSKDHRGVKLEKVSDTDKSFAEDVAFILNTIKEGTLKKAVACSTANYKILEHGHPLVNIIRQDIGEANIYGVWDDSQIIIGLSPEPLIIRDRAGYITYALAGSFPVDSSEDLLKSEKNLSEHNLVIKDIQDKLLGHTKDLKIGKTHLHRFGPINHLRTELRFSSALQPIKLAQKLSPTSALGGYPSEESLKCLKKLNYFGENGENRLFGGCFGVSLGNENTFGLVAIRNLFFFPEYAQIHSGAGIVQGSNINDEMSEIELKRESIARSFL